MSSRPVRPFVVIAVGLLILVPGCWPALIPASSVQVPAALQYVLDHADAFHTEADDPASGTGTAVSDAAELNGCWGAALVESEGAVPIALFIVYRFNSADGTYSCWSAPGRPAGELAPLMPLVSEESGVFVVEPDGVIRTTIQQIRANMDVETGQLTATLQVQYVPTDALDRTLQAVLEGDDLTLLYETDDPNDPGAEGDRVLFRRFDCPVGE
ncbi:MAG: hypothetical protein KKB50_03180 [Planctomycetes bacterium]|nr:hypothetical protein [Planctomycetota bacterium]